MRECNGIDDMGKFGVKVWRTFINVLNLGKDAFPKFQLRLSTRCSMDVRVSMGPNLMG
jgi:hypothetical protein